MSTNNLTTTAYYDRSIESINGLFTVKTVNKLSGLVVREFARLPSSSGQRGYEKISFKRGKAPIPFSNELTKPYKLWIDKPLQEREWAGARGIGAFYAISTENDRITTKNKYGEIRENLGWHPNNLIAGSAGCVVVEADTEERRKQIIAIWDYFDKLAETGITNIPLIVL
jgi:hypothetical protein